MIFLLLWLPSVALASIDCEPKIESEWSGDTYSAILDTEAGEGAIPCRTVDLGSVLEWVPSKLKVVVRQWDDTRTRLGMERLYSEGGRWVVHVPELRTGDRLKIALEAVRMTREPSDTVASAKTEILKRVKDVEWVADGDLVFGPGGTVTQRVSVEQTQKAGTGTHYFWWPSTAVDAQCDAYLDQSQVDVSRSEHGCSASVGEGASELVWSVRWMQQGVPSAAEWLLGSNDTLRIRGGEFISAGLSPKNTEHGLEFQGPGRVSALINKLGEQGIQNNALEEVQYAARAVSIPEPGLGIEFKGYRGNATVIPVLLQKVRSQMVLGRLPDRHPLKPRKLTNARRSRWGTPWEQALILTRYLQQLKIPAEAYPVRPALLGSAVVGVPLGYVGAVVRAETEQGAVWLDPSCSVCAVGEISPSMWGGQVFDLDLTQLPPAPKGTLETNHEDDTLRVKLSGPPALELRRWLTQFPVADRGLKVAEKFGGVGARLVGHEGLTEFGEPITIEIEAQSRR